MISTTLTVTVPPQLMADITALGTARRTITQGAAMGIEAALRDHFQRLQSRSRADGLKPTGFWYDTDGNSVAEHISGHILHDDGSASVTIDSPELRHRLTGGTIKASDYGHPYLTIPANDAAAQAPQGARSFATRIAWVQHPDGGVRPALVASANYVKSTRHRDGSVSRKYRAAGSPQSNAGMGDVLFWLVRQVTHQPMPDALPSDPTLGDAARAAALDALDALTSQGAA